MRYVLFGGNGTVGRWVRDAISRNDTSFQLVWMGDNNSELHGKIIDGVEIIDASSVAEKYKKGEVDIVIVAIDYYWGKQPEVIQQLHQLGIDEIYILPRYLHENDEKIFNVKEYLIKADTSKPCYNHTLNLTINRHCNLNCKGCGMFSNLYREPLFADFEQYKKDLLQFKELVGDVRSVSIFGGEPLLNEEVADYVVLARTLFPSASIHVETNGILLLSCTDELLYTMKNNHAAFYITPYTITKEKRTILLQRLSSFGVYYTYRQDNTDALGFRTTFGKCLDSTGKHDPEVSHADCIKHGHGFNWHLKEGHMSGCQFPLYIDKFNEVYGDIFAVSEEDTINIYEENLDGQQLIDYLLSAKPFCRYCSLEEEKVTFDWTRGTESQMSDWLVNEVEK